MKYRKVPKMRRRAAKLRNNPTQAEHHLWSKLRKRRLGVKFRRQHVFAGYILDFYCASHCVAIELDGEVHDRLKKADEMRDEKLNNLGIKVLRFSNQEVLFHTNEVLASIRSALNT